MAAGKRAGRKYPTRTCIGCREPNPKRGLVRIVRTAERRLEVDTTGRSPGRGAYICRQSACWEKALRAGTIAHALRFSPPQEDLAALRAFAEGMMSEEREPR
ncbi:MAG: RNase P modulator RnpM [Dehalococcoidia bacterium]